MIRYYMLYESSAMTDALVDGAEAVYPEATREAEWPALMEDFYERMHQCPHHSDYEITDLSGELLPDPFRPWMPDSNWLGHCLVVSRMQARGLSTWRLLPYAFAYAFRVEFEESGANYELWEEGASSSQLAGACVQLLASSRCLRDWWQPRPEWAAIGATTFDDLLFVLQERARSMPESIRKLAEVCALLRHVL